MPTACLRTRPDQTVDRTEGFYRIDQLLQEKVLVRHDDFLKALEVSGTSRFSRLQIFGGKSRLRM
jgi:hypothetical protein